MRWLKLSAMAAALVSMAACATPVSRDLVFDSSSANSLLVIASPNQGMATFTEFRRVNLEAQVFEDEIVPVTTAGIGSSNVINYSTDAPFWLSMVEMPPGDYALVSMSTNTFNGQAWLCLSGGPTLSLRAGEISIISTLPLWQRLSGLRVSPSDEEVFAEFERARVNYPNITGAATVGASTSVLSWPETRPTFMQGMNRNCAEPEGFEIVEAEAGEPKLP